MKTPFLFICFVLFKLSAKSQNQKFDNHHLTHEIGVLIGAFSIQTDYGPRQNIQSEIGNAGVSLNLVHYLSFYNKSSSWNARYRFIDDLVIKTELSYLSETQYQFYGEIVESASDKSARYRAIRGTASILNLGINAEYYFKDFRTFSAHLSPFRVNPFINLGILYSSYNNTLFSFLGNWNEDRSVLPEEFRTENAVNIGGGSTFSVVLGTGFRFKLYEAVDLVTNVKYQYLFSDEIDGLNPKTSANTSNEWLIDFQFGVIWRLNFLEPLFKN